METDERDAITVPDALVRFVRAPFRLRTYKNLLYLMLALPLGLGYFVFLSVGLTAGIGLTIIWIGLFLLAVVLAGSWAFAAFERQMAIHLLDAGVAPMLPPAVPAQRTVWQQVRDVLANPVTWKGMAFLLLKLPLGIVSFIVTVALLSVSSAFLLAPVLSALDGWGVLDFDGVVIDVSAVGGVWLCAVIGVGLLFLSLNLLNGLAAVWRGTAVLLLGSERFSEAPPTSGVPVAAVA
jgi:hypothetical protein